MTNPQQQLTTKEEIIVGLVGAAVMIGLTARFGGVWLFWFLVFIGLFKAGKLIWGIIFWRPPRIDWDE